ncbi:MAG: exosortase system-associated protein, TIGR04073 family [Candidatus Omnitrophota bacterium]
MRKFLAMSLVIILMFACVIPAFAKDPGEKLARGVANVISCPLEIPKQIDVEWKAAKDSNQNVGAGIAAGLIKGMAFTVARLGSGIWDIFSFPFQVPENFEPVMKPDYVLEK